MEELAEPTEEMSPELDNMMLLLFDKNEMRTFAKQRQEFEYKLNRFTKKKEDCLRYIQYEMNLLELVKVRREKKGIKIAKLFKIDFVIASRLNKLFILTIRWFPSDIRIWLSYIMFCKQVRFSASVSRVLDQMLELHGDKPEMFQLAAQWELSECLCVEKARKFLIDGLHIHKDSQLLFTEAFTLELIHANNKWKELKEDPGQLNPDDPVLNGIWAQVFYESAVKKIHNAAFVVELLNIAEEYDFTEALQNKILNDMMTLFPSDELTWDTMAKRELKGRVSLNRTPNMTKLTLKGRIGRCVTVYKESIRNLGTQRMWSLYLETLLEIKRDSTRLPIFKKKLLLNALQDGHNAEKLSEEYYLIWADQLNRYNRRKKMLEVLEGATTKLSDSVTLWQARLRMHLTRGKDDIATAVFNLATSALGPNAVPLWKLMLQYWQTKSSDKVEELFKKSMSEIPAISSPLKPLYLEWLVLTHGIKVARKVYASLCNIPPPCLDMHRKMAHLESIQPTLNLKNARHCCLMACLQFGSTNVDVWVDYVKFEQNSGDPDKVSGIYWQAVKTLEPGLTDSFISEFSLAKMAPISQLP